MLLAAVHLPLVDASFVEPRALAEQVPQGFEEDARRHGAVQRLADRPPRRTPSPRTRPRPRSRTNEAPMPRSLHRRSHRSSCLAPPSLQTLIATRPVRPAHE